MNQGIIFDIKEMTVHDGPGVRVTVFFKGCPLRCLWCHNPEGLLPQPQLMNGAICGEILTAAELATKVKKNADVLQELGGGVTISGGEPLMQPEFLLSLLQELAPMHRVLQTSGYGNEGVFVEVIKNCELVHFDLKQMSPRLHKKFTGVDNGLILRNLGHLKDSGKPFVVRLPMIPGVNVTRGHFAAVAQLLEGVRDRVSIEILPYNSLAGAKYPWVGMEYTYTLPTEVEPYPTDIFDKAGVVYKVLSQNDVQNMKQSAKDVNNADNGCFVKGDGKID